jgi:GNAT superfamily N-acetyltransferase
MVTYRWRGHFSNSEINNLHADAFGHEVADRDWWYLVNRHSLGWVCALDRTNLIGFVNVPWDGSSHAFILDTMVVPASQCMGVGSGLVACAAAEARAAGCKWLHVDFEDHLRAFYFDTCGFMATNAGLIDLSLRGPPQLPVCGRVPMSTPGPTPKALP